MDDKEPTEQLQKLNNKNDLLEKQTSDVDDCSSVEELKVKSENPDGNQKTLISLDGATVRLCDDIDPLDYLKSFLERSILQIEEETNQIDSTDNTNIQSQGVQNIKTDPYETDSFLSEARGNETGNVIETNNVLNDEYEHMLLMDGYYIKMLQYIEEYDLPLDDDYNDFVSGLPIMEYLRDIFTAENKKDALASFEPRRRHEDDIKMDRNRNFKNVKLNKNLLCGIFSLGVKTPTDLQQQVILNCMTGKDVIVCAEPGTGKTMMFTIPLLERIHKDVNKCQALVLVPFQNIAEHISEIIKDAGKELKVNVCVAGENDEKGPSSVPHVIVGTPTTVFYMIEEKSLETESIKTVVLRHAENMLTANYTKVIKQIMDTLVKEKQIILLTSDKLDTVLDEYAGFLHDPLIIINDNIVENKIIKNLPKQFYLNVEEDLKINTIGEIYETLKIQHAIIYCNTLDRAKNLCQSLQQLEYSVIHYNCAMSVDERRWIIHMFYNNDKRVIITTDPIKGKLFKQAAWFINYDMPRRPFQYLDRVVKCAENIKVLNLVTKDDDDAKTTIENHNKSYMMPMPMNMTDLLQN